MSTEAIGFPLPVFVKGYACLTADEMALAKKDVDPARPQDGAGGEARGEPSRAAADPARIAAARDDAQRSGSRLISYAPGAERTAAVGTGTLFSIRA